MNRPLEKRIEAAKALLEPFEDIEVNPSFPGVKLSVNIIVENLKRDINEMELQLKK